MLQPKRAGRVSDLRKPSRGRATWTQKLSAAGPGGGRDGGGGVGVDIPKQAEDRLASSAAPGLSGRNDGQMRESQR